MESAFLPLKQIKPITFLFISLVKTVISLTQEMLRCMRPRSILEGVPLVHKNNLKTGLLITPFCCSQENW